MLEDEQGPMRTCAVLRVSRPVDELIRFALSPEGVVTPDLRQRLPGRGVWVSARRKQVAEAARKQVFSRGFRTRAEAPADLADQVDRLLARDALSALSFANKAGEVVAGFAKVEAEVLSGRAMALIRAGEAGADGARKLAAAARRAARGEPETIALFASPELDVALGRENVIHAALKRGGAAQNFLARCERLGFYRAQDEPAGEKPATPAGQPFPEAGALPTSQAPPPDAGPATHGVTTD